MKENTDPTTLPFTNYFGYCAGRLYNKIPRGKAKVGYHTATFDPSSGYNRFKWMGRTWLEHRVIFFLRHGYFPKMVDHINGNKLDNRVENLRDAVERRNNTVNSKLRTDNSTGFRGVHNHKMCNGWVAQGSKEDGSRVHLGTFTCIKEAALAYNHHAENTYGPFATFNQVF